MALLWSSRRRQVTRPLAALFFVALLIYTFSPALPSFHAPRESLKLEKYMNAGQGTSRDAVPSSFDWSRVKHTHLPPAELIKLPSGRAKRLPRVQSSVWHESSASAKIRESRRDDVRNVFRNDWQSYRKYAWKKDALNPLSGQGKDQFSGWAATLVDALDSLWIMGLRSEFDEAVAAVAEIDFGQSTSARVNIFETNIRYLGGLLAAYDLSGRKALLTKAVELGDLIYGGFNTPSLLPVDFIDFATAKTGNPLSIEQWVVSASPGSLSLEMTRLSQLTGNPKYYDVVARVMRLFAESQEKTKIPGLWPIWISMNQPDLTSRKEFTLGGSADSLYEYLPKMYALLGGLEPMYEGMTKSFLKAASSTLFFRPMLPGGEDILVSGNVNVGNDGSMPLDPETEHLTCFIGGTVALAGRLFRQSQHVEAGAKLAEGCAFAYHSFESGVMPERINMVPCEPRQAVTCPWNETKWEEERSKRPQWKAHLPKGFTTAKDPRYLLRPEAIESVFYMYRITGDPIYQEMAWKMFNAVVAASETKLGHASIRDVTIKIPYKQSRDHNLEDYMESFWFAETLKYFYLIFSPPDLIDLDEFVLNTEAHPFRRPQ
ncbi:Mannosyl-oligosaccharide 1,2-alpha-mannosidase MNS1 [Paramyrothecium foliicola]|nr:Mannosyl-oligosaccharide 1,2-alpha-mannosidase MNS1 [Paramyrothecium foliicola]